MLQTKHVKGICQGAPELGESAGCPQNAYAVNPSLLNDF
jgi:hypothetical protein